MNRSSSWLPRTLLALALLLATGAGLQAQPEIKPSTHRTIAAAAPAGHPVFAGVLSFRGRGGRAWVVRVAALGMALALFIIMRGSSRY